MAELIAQFDEYIRRDPARRGLIATEPQFGPLCPGHLAAAARDLADHAACVGIVTGFFIPRGEPPAAETDGPPGAVLLAQALDAVGIDVWLITDPRCESAVRGAMEGAGFPVDRLIADSGGDAAWAEQFLSRLASQDRSGDTPEHAPQALTHLIAVERVGPSHTTESLCAQRRAGAAPVEDFERLSPMESRNHCHNMRGDIIDEYTGSLHRLFEELPRVFPHARTIGIGDGGNEIGMGAIPWEELQRRLSGDPASRIPCRIATDWNILAGTSNWGAMALAAATLLLRGEPARLRPWNRDHQRHVLEHMVETGPAVDGITRYREPSVDGIPFLTYIQPWEGIRRLLGLD